MTYLMLNGGTGTERFAMEFFEDDYGDEEYGYDVEGDDDGDDVYDGD